MSLVWFFFKQNTECSRNCIQMKIMDWLDFPHFLPSKAWSRQQYLCHYSPPPLLSIKKLYINTVYICITWSELVQQATSTKAKHCLSRGKVTNGCKHKTIHCFCTFQYKSFGCLTVPRYKKNMRQLLHCQGMLISSISLSTWAIYHNYSHLIRQALSRRAGCYGRQTLENCSRS